MVRKASSKDDAIRLIDQLTNNKKDDGLIDITPIGDKKTTNVITTVVNTQSCDFCDQLPSDYWKCLDCGFIICYQCVINNNTIRMGEIKLRCACGSKRLFYKHNILTQVFGFRK